MKQICEVIYQSMQDDLLHCINKQLSVVTEIECCYQIASNYWHLLKQRISDYEFETVEDEIYFFKKRKPNFTSEILYYELLYQLYVFQPENLQSQKNHLLREKKKLEKFIFTYPDFYEYYKSGETSEDEVYFVKLHSQSGAQHPHFLDENLMSSYDHLLAEFMALERYNAYLADKLNELDN